MKLVSSFFSFMNGLYYFSIPLIFSPEWVFMTPPRGTVVKLMSHEKDN